MKTVKQKNRLIVFSNEAGVATCDASYLRATDSVCDELCNETTTLSGANAASANTTGDNWLRLAEYGDWPHPRGLQRFTPAAANAMVRYFKSLRGRLARRFGGLPVYIGHPDDNQFSGKTGHTDTRAYAWVTDLQTRSDGLYAAFKWSGAGDELLRNAFYKFLSPRWVMEPLGKDVFQPVRLLSVGLTNQPNIPGDAIANSSAAVEIAVDSAKPAALSAGEDATPGQATTHAENYTREELCTALGISTDIDPVDAIGELREQSDRFYRIACDQSEALGRQSGATANARQEHIELAVQNALLSGRIAPHEAQTWRNSFEQNWAQTAEALCTNAVTLKTTAIANARTQPQTQRTAQTLIQSVEAHAKEKEIPFAAAWTQLKRNRPELFQNIF